MKTKSELAAVNTDSQNDYSKSNLSRDTNAARIINNEFLTHVFERNERRIGEKISQEFRRTESRRILSALSKSDEFF